LARESISGSFADSMILARIWRAIAVCKKKLLIKIFLQNSRRVALKGV